MYIDKIPDDAVQIKDSFDYIDTKGNVYGIEVRPGKHKGEPFIKALNTVYGYKYCGINYKDGRHLSRRVHRLVAEAFIPNPNNFPIVMHIDNNKANNNVHNLKWGTISENTKQAFNDGLTVNKKGFEDEQSIPCDCYDTLTNRFVGSFGSVSIASEEMNISKCGILYQIRNPEAPIRKPFYFVKHNDPKKEHDVIGQFDINTDEEIARFVNIKVASESTNIVEQTIAYQVKKNQKIDSPKYNFYFKRIKVS